MRMSFPPLIRRHAAGWSLGAVVFAGLTLTTAEGAAAIAISNVQFNPGPHAALSWDRTVTVTWDHSLGFFEEDGVRIFVRPFTTGALSPHYAASGGVLYLPGSTGGSSTFRITSGDVLVDEVRFQVFDPSNNLRLEFFVPCSLQYGACALYNLTMTPSSPSCVSYEQRIEFTFDYMNPLTEDVHVFIFPYSGLTSVHHYYSGSLWYPPGSGSGDYWIRIPQQSLVDRFRVVMRNSVTDEILTEFWVAVRYQAEEASVYNITLSPASPAGRLHSENVTVNLDYRTTEAGGVRIYAIPCTDGAPSPDAVFSGSSLCPTGTGHVTRSFRITSGDAVADSVRCDVYNADNSRLITRYFVPVNFHYAEQIVRAAILEHPSPSYFNHGSETPPPGYPPQDAFVDLEYTISIPEGVRMVVKPFTNGSLSPGCFHAGGQYVPAGSGTLTGLYVGVLDEPQVIDQLLVRIYQASAPYAPISDWYVDVRLRYGNQPMTSDAPIGEPAATAALFRSVTNPAIAGGRLSYLLPEAADVRLEAFDASGRRVATLANGVQEGGIHDLTWGGREIAPGVYFLRLRAQPMGGPAMTDQRKVVLIR